MYLYTVEKVIVFPVPSRDVTDQTLPELVVLVDFVFPWGIKYPVVFLPQGLFTLWCLQMAKF
jgi:hypothetical protein